MPWSGRSSRSPSPCSTSTCGCARKVSISTSLRARPPHRLRRPKRLHRGASAGIFLLFLGLLVASGVTSASASSADDYTNAVHRALTPVQFAERGDAPSVQQAIDVLARDTGHRPPEILRDPRRHPTDLADADQRLQAVSDTAPGR